VVGDEPFAMLWGDDLVLGEPPFVRQLIDAHERTGGAVVGVISVPPQEAVKYGVIEIAERLDERLVRASRIVEKPPLDAVPSNLAAVAGYLLTPSRLGAEYGFLPDRLAWFPPLLLVLFCATRPPVRAAARLAVAGALVLAATAAVLIRLPTQLHDQRVAAEELSIADDLEPGSTFAVVRFTRYSAQVDPLESGPDPLRHLSSGIAVRADGVDVGHYEAVFPYFQVRFVEPSVRSRLDPGLDGLEHLPPSVDLPAVAGQLDYVVLVGWADAPASVRQDPGVLRLMADLRAGYRQVATSSPSGVVNLWKYEKHPSG
jgi:hypothetical protein